MTNYQMNEEKAKNEVLEDVIAILLKCIKEELSVEVALDTIIENRKELTNARIY